MAQVHGYYYYMVKGSPHMWLMCTVITTIYGGGEPSRVAINMHSKYLMCMVVTRIWWRGPLTCGHLMCMLITRIWWLTIKST